MTAFYRLTVPLCETVLAIPSFNNTRDDNQQRCVRSIIQSDLYDSTFKEFINAVARMM